MLNDKQFDALRAVQAATAQLNLKRHEYQVARKGLRRARRRLALEIQNDPASWRDGGGFTPKGPYINGEVVESTSNTGGLDAVSQ